MLIPLSSLQYTTHPRDPTHPDSYYTHAHLLVSTCTPAHAPIQPFVQTRATFAVPVIPLTAQAPRRPVVMVQIFPPYVPVYQVISRPMMLHLH
ncbi:hypothetical protein BJV77DRAFT_794988 [Russula vinacea]|nr:hypothetical protein BJV77DRAFT_794988 [Russula vinacea]